MKNNERIFQMIESDGNLLMAICYDIHSRMHRYWHVYQFDPLQKNWTRIQTLGDRVLILQDSKIASIAVHAAKEFANMIT